MGQYIDKAAIVAEIERMLEAITNASEQDVRDRDLGGIYDAQLLVLRNLAKYLDTIEVEEIQKKNLYVVTRCEEHSDYVEKVFFSKEKAEDYCKQFEGNEDAYGRDITEIEVDYPLEVKEVDSSSELKEVEKEVADAWISRLSLKGVHVNLKGEVKTKFHNDFHTIWQTVGKLQFANVAKAIIEKMCLYFATWGAYYLKDCFKISEDESSKLDVKVKEVDLGKLGEIARHLIAVKEHIEDMRLDKEEWFMLEKIGYPERFKAQEGE